MNILDIRLSMIPPVIQFVQVAAARVVKHETRRVKRLDVIVQLRRDGLEHLPVDAEGLVE